MHRSSISSSIKIKKKTPFLDKVDSLNYISEVKILVMDIVNGIMIPIDACFNSIKRVNYVFPSPHSSLNNNSFKNCIIKTEIPQ